jgi:nucleotide-binding universal stress UspA family protein
MTGDVFHTLAATDFSQSSLAAIDFALVLARAEAAPAVHVVHAIGLPTLPMPSGEAIFAADFEQRAREQLDGSLQEIARARRNGVPIETHLVLGAPAPAILEEARRLGCQRIVVGATGRGVLPRFLVGNVADRLIRTSPIPVVVVPLPGKDAAPKANVRNIVCAVDFSASSETATLAAVDLARRHGARLHLVHAWHVAPYVEHLPELAASIDHDMSLELDATAERHARPELTITRHVRRGGPAHQIVAAARELDADLVVIGTTGKSGFDRLLLGSVAERVIRTSHVPVFVAPTHF